MDQPLAIIRAKWILPVDQPPFENGMIAIRNGSIESIDVGRSVPANLDLGDSIIFPQFVNAHTHLEFSRLSNPLGQPGIAFAEWIRLVLETRRNPTRCLGESAMEVSPIRAGIAESLEAGVAAIGEIRSLPASSIDYLQPEIACTVFHERLGLVPSSVPSIVSELDSTLAESPGRRETIRDAISPHAPYSTHIELVHALADCATRYGVPLAMHLAESREELELLSSRRGPLRDLLDDLGVWSESAIPAGLEILDFLKILSTCPRSTVVHGNYLSDVDLDFIAEHRRQMGVVYCPRTHAYFRHDPYPLRQLVQRGIDVSIATDSRASNPDLNLGRDIKLAVNLFPDISPREFLEMATINPARAIGLESMFGSLARGKKAKLALVPIPANSNLEPERLWLESLESIRRVDTGCLPNAPFC